MYMYIYMYIVYIYIYVCMYSYIYLYIKTLILYLYIKTCPWALVGSKVPESMGRSNLKGCMGMSGVAVGAQSMWLPLLYCATVFLLMLDCSILAVR